MPEQQVSSAVPQAGRAGLWFVAVGGTASLTHMAVFALFRLHVWPELANACGFLIAFFVSFAGHRFLSFRDTQTSLGQSFTRFVATALAGFACNEAVFMLLLRLLQWPDWAALGCALVIAAGQTFLLSRYWAFKR